MTSGHTQEKTLRCNCIAGFRDHQSGRPDLNRGPPAPKAGAIPGYATPREPQNVSTPNPRINWYCGDYTISLEELDRPEQRAKRTTAMTHLLHRFAARLAKRRSEL